MNRLASHFTCPAILCGLLLALGFGGPVRAQTEKMAAPEAMQVAPGEVSVVPPVVNDTCEVATRLVRARGLQISRNCLEDPAAVIASQSPDAKRPAKPGSVVTVTLKVIMARVPSLQGRTLDAAAEALSTAHLQLGTVTPAVKSLDSLLIATQSQQPGTEVPVNSSINVTLQTAKPPPVQYATVPDLTGRSKAEAVGALAKAGLRLGNPDVGDAGTVSGQKPVGNQQVVRGSPVFIALTAPATQGGGSTSQQGGNSGSTSPSGGTGSTLQPIGGTGSTTPTGSIGTGTQPDGTGGTQSAGGAGAGTVPTDGGGAASETDSVTIPQASSAPRPATSSVPWMWIGIVTAVVVVGALVGPRIWRALFAAAEVTTLPHPNAAMARVRCNVLPAIKFTVSLRDRPVAAAYRSVRVPEIIEKGNSPS